LLFRSVLTCLLVLTLLAPVRRANACGPDFPPEYLGNRTRTLAELPDGAFMLEASRLLPKPADDFRVAESWEEPEGSRTGGGARETELYQAGAKAFHAGNWEEARARFLEVLALPEEERRHASTFAAYMLGRTAGSATEARERFNEVRELARQGFHDPLGLAVASLGEEARTYLREGDDAGAIQLYAQQAAHGSTSGATSLLMVARGIARGDEARLKKALKDPLAQRLLATYAWTRGQEPVWTEDYEQRPSPLPRLLDALAAVPGLAGADRLAAGAWRAGRFDLAERFAGQEKTPLSAWVKAKLALRRGDRAEAERLLAEAAEGLPETDDWSSSPEMIGSRRPRSRVEGERALLALARGDFAQAAERAMASCSWQDIAYVAERVLTVEELQRLIAAHASDPVTRCQPEQAFFDEGQDVVSRLRLVLGRRLMRSGKGPQALEYFQGTKWEEPARKYVEELERGRSAWDDVDKAQALYSAARLARTVGMELMGTEAAPDWTWVEGLYDLGALDEQEQPAEGTPARPEQDGAPLATDAERQRLTAHAPPYTMRFHYRFTAAALAEEAAALVPPRSHAYATLLCHAARFSSDEPARVQRLWFTYVKNGAAIPGMTFGQSCPEPDFERLRNQKLAMPWKAWRLRTLATVGGGLLLLPVMGAALFFRRKRRDTVNQTHE
jgi:hypothetical protein